MPLLGAHMSIAGGFHKAVEAAAALGMDTVQIFTHSPSQWVVKPEAPTDAESLRAGTCSAKNDRWRARDINDDEVAKFRHAIAASGIQCPLAHDSYLINLASPDAALWKKSLAAFVVEIQRCDRLGLAYLVAHPGSSVTLSEQQGIARVAEALDAVHRQTRGARVQVLLETTAGQGTNLGHRFEHLAAIIDQVRDPDRLGVCFDTCHAFAAGYGMGTEREYHATMDELDRVLGLERVKAFHLNDSKRELGSRVDRHEQIGRGRMGLAPFRFLMNDPRFRRVPMCLETPKGREQGRELDAINLRTLRRLIRPTRPPLRRRSAASGTSRSRRP